MKRFRHILAVIMAFMYCFCCFSVISAKASTDEFTIRDGVLKKYSGSGGAVVIPDGVKIIDREAFYKCSTLTSIVIPESVTDIRARAFQGTSLTNISIPATVDGIYEFSLSINTLTSIEVDPENQVYSSLDGVLYTKDRTALLVYPRNKPNTSYEVPKGVTRIANWAYYEGNLKSISLPDTIKSIGEGAFFNGGIQTVYYEGSKEDWNKINIRTANSGLMKAEIRYNSYQTDSLSKAEAFQIKERVPVMDFTDVPSSAWYSESIKLVCEHHIMNGIGKTTFLPNGTLTIGEAIAIASRLHDSYYGNNTVFQSGTPWYQPYVDYARRCGIINGEYQYNMPVSRAEFALFIGNSLSDEMLAPINKVGIGDIPDVYYLIPSQDAVQALSKAGVIGPSDSENLFSLLMILRKATDNGASSTDLSDAIYKLYRAGVIAGNDEYGTFTPNASLTRSAAAAILSRVVEPALRQRLDLLPKPSTIVPLQQLTNYSSLKKRASTQELAQAYEAAKGIAEPLINLSREAQLTGIMLATRLFTDKNVEYSQTAPHHDDPYGFFVLKKASCAGNTRATGLCLNMLGIPYEHVNENDFDHQWTRVKVGETYWICDAYDLYCGPEPAPYKHPNN